MLGASTFYKGNRIQIMSAHIEESDYDFHPFYYGRVVNITEQGFVKVACNDGLLVVSKIKYDGVLSAPNEVIKISNILHTPAHILEKARTETFRTFDMDQNPKI